MAIECDWIFLNRDGTVARQTISEPRVPSVNDGKIFSGIGYEVVFVGEKLVSRKNPLVLAVEHP